jgi:hypothetical protein
MPTLRLLESVELITIESIIARSEATKQSRVCRRRAGLPRFARNDGRNGRHSSGRGKPMAAKRGSITRVMLEKARRMRGKTDFAWLDALTDADIAKAVADDPDAAPLDMDWTKARLVLSPGKDAVTLRLDRDVLD